MTDKGLYSSEFEKDACGIGFIARVNNTPSYDIVRDGLAMLANMEHRGGVAADGETGDGAGIMTQIPHELFKREASERGVFLPNPDEYGVGVVFMPRDESYQEKIILNIEAASDQLGFEKIWLRKVRVLTEVLGPVAQESEPAVCHLFVRYQGLKGKDLNRKLFVLRKLIEQKMIGQVYEKGFYIPSFSTKIIVYKGELRTWQLNDYYYDLNNPDYKSAIALVHSRFSTNTSPEWRLAQPFRYLAHNGEINTIKGNINKMISREVLFSTTNFTAEELDILLPICNNKFSDSANLDAALELLVMGGRSIEHAMAMLVPEAWQMNAEIDHTKTAFYEYNSTIMEPWDGPASLIFTDGYTIGATLDRNGLRPSRYCVTLDGRIILGSEVGAVKVDPANIRKNGRLGPGQMLLVNLESGTILYDGEIKRTLAEQFPYQKWVEDELLKVNDFMLKDAAREYNYSGVSSEAIKQKQLAYGYTREDLKFILEPMIKSGTEPIGSMGNDSALSVFRNENGHISTYFKQLFAQVSNPAIDPIREKSVMSLVNYLGTNRDITTNNPKHARKLRLEHPILNYKEFEFIKNVNANEFASVTIDATFLADEDIKSGLLRIAERAREAVESGANILILSNRDINKTKRPIPSLLSTGIVHNDLLTHKLKGKVSIVVDGGDVIETHHFATLIGYGAVAIFPYLVYDYMRNLPKQALSGKAEVPYNQYTRGINYGLRKILSKMGISTIQSYESAQIFEIIGLSNDVIETCFKGTPGRISGKGFSQLEDEISENHELAYANLNETARLKTGGLYQWKRDGVPHLFTPEVIHALQKSTRSGDYELFKKYTAAIDEQVHKNITLRSLFEFAPQKSISIDEIEKEETIMKRFATGAMSFGSISEEAHTTIAKALNLIGGKSNSGEGGEDADRFTPGTDGLLARSATKQVASGRFGVTAHYLVNADEIQIKISQGAKPGEGGQLPGKKVDDNIARIRHSTPGVTLISPPPHHDIYSIEDLAQLIYDLKNVNSQADINVKLVAESGVGTIAAGVAKAKADAILIAGHDGGTGASPISSIQHAGAPWELGLAETHQTLLKNDLRKKIRLQVDGQLRTGRDLAIATMLGAEEWGISTAVLVVEGCIMMRKCHLNTCPVGIATQNPELRQLFSGKVEDIVNFFKFLARELREIMAQVGVRTVDELVGRADLLTFERERATEIAGDINLEPLLSMDYAKPNQVYCKTEDQDHELEKVLDRKLIDNALSFLSNRKSTKTVLPIGNQNRATGAMLSGDIATKFGAQGLEHNTITMNFLGSAGQSFGAFLAKGITFNLEGEANDYVGKGLSGGRLVCQPFKKSNIKAEDNILIGNVGLYGATSGELFVGGMAGERFAVRNSGAHAVTEGVGDHGCEYMTGGSVIILGETGRNFAAGMSGGMAYIYVARFDFRSRCNMEMIDLEVPEEDDYNFILKQVDRHSRYTGSETAYNILENWEKERYKFLKVMPKEYKQVLLSKQLKRTPELV